MSNDRGRLAAGWLGIWLAVATNARMGLTAPTSNAIGGDPFAIIYEAKIGSLYGLNASGWALAGLSHEFVKSKSLLQCRAIASIRSLSRARWMAGPSFCRASAL